MPDEPIIKDSENILARQPESVVPLVALGDDSDFARRACHAIENWTEQRLRPAILHGKTAEPLDTLNRIWAAGYRQTLGAEISYWEHQPAWCIWFIHAERTTAASVGELTARLPQPDDQPIQHFLFVLVSPATPKTQLRAWRDLPSSDESLRVFLLKEEPALNRCASTLAVGAAAFAFGGWRQFCCATDGHDAAAPLQLPAGDSYWLNAAVCGPDIEFHAANWALTVAQDMKVCWLQETVTAEGLKPKPFHELKHPGEVPSWLALLRFLLPQEEAASRYHVASVSDQTDEHELTFADDVFAFTYTQKPAPLRPAYFSPRERLADALSHQKNAHYFLRLVALKNTRSWIAEHGKTLPEPLVERLRGHVQLPKKPESLFHVLLQKISHCKGYTNALLQMGSHAKRPLEAFEADTQRVITRITRIPSAGGIMLRLLLVLLGLAWLMLGPVVWGSILRPWEHPLLWKVSLGAATLLALLLIGSCVSYFVSIVFGWNALRVLQANSIAQHLADVGETLQSELKGLGQKLDRHVSVWVKNREKLAKHVQAWDAKLDRDPSNNESFFSKTWADVLLSQPSRLDGFPSRRVHLLQLSYEMFRAHWGTEDWRQFDTSEWERRLLEAVTTVSRQTLERLPIAAWLSVGQPQPQEITTRLNALLQEAKRGLPNPLCVCYAPNAWKEHRGIHDNVDFFDPGLTHIVAVTATKLEED